MEAGRTEPRMLLYPACLINSTTGKMGGAGSRLSVSDVIRPIWAKATPQPWPC